MTVNDNATDQERARGCVASIGVSGSNQDQNRKFSVLGSTSLEAAILNAQVRASQKKDALPLSENTESNSSSDPSSESFTQRGPANFDPSANSV